MHEENLLSSWLTEDLVSREKKERTESKSSGRRTAAAERGRRWREEEEKTVLVKRRCIDPFFPVMFLRKLVFVDDLGSFRDSWNDFHGDSCGFSECVPAVVVGCACCD